MGRPITNEAADLIEAQAKRIEELEGALRWYVSDDVKESWWIVDEIGDRIQQFAEIGERARRALAGKEDT
jgi:hypothetical protein